jgi:hypothetical protein
VGPSPTSGRRKTEHNVLSSCRASAIAAGSEAAAADANCACFLRGVEAKYTEAEFATIEAEMQIKKTSVPDEMIKIIGECRVSSSAH